MIRVLFSGPFFVIFSYLLLNNLFNSFAGECDQWAQHPEWLWCDDFEGNKSLKQNYQDVSEDGLSINTYAPFEGNYSLQQSYNQGQVDAGWVIRVNNQGFPPHLFMRWYHKFDKGFDGFPPKMARMRYRNRSGDWKSAFAVHCWIDNGYIVADVSAKNSSQANGGWLSIAKSNFSFNNPVNIGRWICFEMEVLLNTPGKSDGLYRIWADDSLLIERDNVDLRGSENHLINEVMLDCYWNGGSPKNQKRYFDNFIISTNKIGPFQNVATLIKLGKINKINFKNHKSYLQGLLNSNSNSCSGIYFSRTDMTNATETFSLNGRKSVNNSLIINRPSIRNK